MRGIRQGAELAGHWPNLDAPERRTILQHLVARIVLRRGEIEICIRPSSLSSISDPQTRREPLATDAGETETLITLCISAELKRAGMATRLFVDGTGTRREPDRSMLRLFAQARCFNEMLMRGDGMTIADMAKQAGVSPSYFTRIVRLSFLAPNIIRAILNDRHPPELTARRLSLHTRIVNDWSGQKALLGMA